MVTIFSPMRPFHGSIALVQLNAVESWLRVDKEVEIILFEDEESTIHHFLEENENLRILNFHEKSFSGVPLLSSMYEIVYKIAKNTIICYLTADILLPDYFTKVLMNFHNRGKGELKNFVGISSRYDIVDSTLFRFKNEDIESYYQRCLLFTKKRERSGIDLWVTFKNLPVVSPPFPIGRCLTDNWFICYCKVNHWYIVDLSDAFKIIHQNHEKPAKLSNYFILEKILCHSLFRNASFHGGDIHDSDLLYNGEKFLKPRGLRRLQQKLYTCTLYRNLLSIRRKVKNPLYRIEWLF